MRVPFADRLDRRKGDASTSTSARRCAESPTSAIWLEATEAQIVPAKRLKIALADLFWQTAAGFEVGEETLDFRVAVQAVELFGNVIAEKLDFG